MGNYNIKYSLSDAISDIKPLNQSFDLATLRVAYVGINPNTTSISKQAFEDCAYTMYNCPIVANYDAESNTIGGHDEMYVETPNGARFINITEPVGVVPESATYRWETIEDSNGVHEYFCIDGVILWKRQACYQRIAENGITSQSMEISGVDGSLVNGILNIDKFEFEAFCLLERDDPCFEQASLQLFSHGDFKKQWMAMMKEFATITNPNATIGGANVETQNVENVEIELAETEPTNSEIVEEVEIVETKPVSEEVVEDSEGTTEKVENADESEDVVTEEVAAESTDEQSEVVEYELEQPEKEQITLTAGQISDAIHIAVKQIFDYDDVYVQDWDNTEIYLFDYKTGRIFGYAYQISGMDVIIDTASKKEKRLAYLDVENEENVSAMSKVIQAIVDASASEYASKIDSLNNQIEELQTYKNNKIAAERQIAETALFERFETQLKNCSEFKELKDKSKEFSITEIEQKCYAILGKQTYSIKTNMATKIAVDRTDVSEQSDSYGGLLKNKNYI